MKVLGDNHVSMDSVCEDSENDSLEALSLQGLRQSWLERDLVISDFLSYLTEYQGKTGIFFAFSPSIFPKLYTSVILHTNNSHPHS